MTSEEFEKVKELIKNPVEVKNTNFARIKLQVSIVELNSENVVLAEAKIRTDSKYKKDLEIAPPSEKNIGTALYWMKQLRLCLDREKTDNTRSFNEIVQKSMKCVAKENSLRMSDEEIDEISERVIEIGKEKFKEELANDNKKYELFKKLAEETKRGNRNFSFASKFCHYASLQVFDDEEHRDAYSIYDALVSKAIPLYAELMDVPCDFRNKKDQVEKYKSYQETIGKIIEKLEESGEKISRTDLDHLLWYSSKTGEQGIKRVQKYPCKTAE